MFHNGYAFIPCYFREPASKLRLRANLILNSSSDRTQLYHVINYRNCPSANIPRNTLQHITHEGNYNEKVTCSQYFYCRSINYTSLFSL